MNRITYCITAAIALLALFSCSEDPDVFINAPSIELQAPTNILRTSASLSGQLTQTELSDVSEVVILLGSSSDFESSTVQTYTATCEDDGSFSVSLRDLDIMTSYFYQAYATNGYDKVTSTSYSFTTAYQSGALLSTPELIDSATNTFEVEVEDDGGAEITATGFCWGLSSKPTIYDSQLLTEYDESLASFSASLTELSGEVYYIRAFAANDAIGDGSTTIAYSDEIIFDATDVEVELDGKDKSAIISIPDANFKAYLVENFDTSGDGEISIAEAEAVTSISANELEIESLEGIEYFVNLTCLYCGINEITTLDVSKNVELQDLRCWNNQLTTLDLSNNLELTNLGCDGNQLTTLDLSKHVELTTLYCGSNELTTLDVSNNVELTFLSCYSNPLTTLNVSNNVELITLYCFNNELTTLDVSNNVELTCLHCSSNQLTTLDVSNNVELIYLTCYGNQLNTLNLSSNVELTYLSCWSNELTTLDLSKNVELIYVWCASNELTALDVSNNVELTYLSCYSNQLTTLDVSNNVKLTDLSCYSNEFTTLDVSNNVELTDLLCGDNPLTSLDISVNTLLTTMRCYNTSDLYTIYVWDGFQESDYPDFQKDDQASYVVKGSDEGNNGDDGSSLVQNIDIPDANFKAYLVENFDTSGDGEISTSEAEAVTSISARGLEIESLEGIEYFVNITSLNCYNNQLTSLELSQNTKLTYIVCESNQLISLDVSKNIELTHLYCYKNQLISLDVSQNTRLINLSCTSNNLTSLDVSKNTELTSFDCAINELAALDVSNQTKLTYLFCSSNSLTSLNVSNSTELTSLLCQDVQLAVLDISNNTKLTKLSCSVNSYLYTIYVWDGFDENDYPDFTKDSQASYVTK